jgi:hypothetical protein
MVWSGLKWCRIVSNGWFLWTRWWTFGLHNSKESLDHLTYYQLLKKCLYTMELDTYELWARELVVHCAGSWWYLATLGRVSSAFRIGSVWLKNSRVLLRTSSLTQEQNRFILHAISTATSNFMRLGKQKVN